MMDEREKPVYEALRALDIPYTRFAHAAAMTMSDCEGFDAAIQAAHCKNLFLTNRQGTAHYLLLVAGNKPFQTKEISRQLGVARLSFGSAEQLMDKLGLTPGAVTPMGLINDAPRDVHVLIDRDLTAWENIAVHPNVNTASIVLQTKDLLRFISAHGNKITYVYLDSNML